MPISSKSPLFAHCEPWQTSSIEGDGNCFFRCIAEIITGSQEDHSIFRSTIASFIASEGTTRLGWYFKQKNTTPFHYLVHERPIQNDGEWASDVEIMATSALLKTDIYVANNIYTSFGTLNRETRWSLIRPSAYDENPSLYITNYGHHYEPVISMINSSIPTYGNVQSKALTID